MAEKFHVGCEGKFKKGRFSLLVGDHVVFKDVPEDGSGVIEEILPRRNCLIRPPIANVDQVVLVFAATNPAPSPVLIDRFLVLCEHAGFSPLLCFNKVDEPNIEQELQPLYDLYARQVGYRVFALSAQSGYGLEALMACLQGRITAFAGPSGVGKSTLLNPPLSRFFVGNRRAESQNFSGTSYHPLCNAPSA